MTFSGKILRVHLEEGPLFISENHLLVEFRKTGGGGPQRTASEFRYIHYDKICRQFLAIAVRSTLLSQSCAAARSADPQQQKKGVTI